MDLLLSGGTRSFPFLATSDAAVLRSIFQVVYVAPDLGETDYSLLQLMVAPGGFIDEFVRLGAVAVINVAGTGGDQTDVAPAGVGFSSSVPHNAEDILLPDHPYFTGLGFGGDALRADDFSGWQPTDWGTLTNLPPDAVVLLANSDGPSLAEYRHGNGRVIVSTLSYCWEGRANSDEGPARNLLLYSRFFSGGALTPAPTVTPTPSPTVTPTATVTSTQAPTPTPSTTATQTRAPTPSPTAAALPGDVNGDGVVDLLDLNDLLAAIFSDTATAAADVNGDGQVSAADIPALLHVLD